MRQKEQIQSEPPHQNSKLFPIFIPRWVRDILASLKGAPLSVWLAYSSFANKDGLAFPSVRTLCRVTGYGIEAVKKARALLIGMGLLAPVEQERAGGKFGRKIFRVFREARPET